VILLSQVSGPRANDLPKCVFNKSLLIKYLFFTGYTAGQKPGRTTGFDSVCTLGIFVNRVSTNTLSINFWRCSLQNQM